MGTMKEKRERREREERESDEKTLNSQDFMAATAGSTRSRAAAVGRR